jgi:hypothetical protein
MEFEEMVSVLKMVNKREGGYVSDKVLEEILALVFKNPLDSDRGLCQERIMTIINQRSEEAHYDNK